MKSTAFTFKDKEGQEIFVYKWAPAGGKAHGVIQIAHGMAEHAFRYERAAKLFTSAGYIVYANDHRGHGKTAGTLDRAGILAPQNGFRITLDDMHELTQLIKKENPKMDVYLLAHSFGSLMAHGYLALYGK
ncbi:MAG: alpha/beta hydrolase, partial [Spirochaetota bacterium]